MENTKRINELKAEKKRLMEEVRVEVCNKIEEAGKERDIKYKEFLLSKEEVQNIIKNLKQEYFEQGYIEEELEVVISDFSNSYIYITVKEKLHGTKRNEKLEQTYCNTSNTYSKEENNLISNYCRLHELCKKLGETIEDIRPILYGGYTNAHVKECYDSFLNYLEENNKEIFDKLQKIDAELEELETQKKIEDLEEENKRLNAEIDRLIEKYEPEDDDEDEE